MPFGLRFKRTRRYDISTKNVFMVEVQMLDNTFLECTLTADSTGHECLDGIAQKIKLTDTEHFGLRYVTKKLQFRWVDLTKPLKKQLEKYAQTSQDRLRSPRLYFGVMFYIANAHKIVDDVARYQYYLQLKNDFVDERLPQLTEDQVMWLAALSLQVEFSDYEYDRTASDYFTDNMVFPKNLAKGEHIVTELMGYVLQLYAGLRGVHPVKAEIQYMKIIQMMDGYGTEYYVAKDEHGNELYLGTSYVGIFARYLDGHPTILFKWTEIARLSQSKKIFEIDTSKSSVQYTMEDSDTAKYLKRMCILQQKFYKSSKTMLSSSLTDVGDFEEAEMIPDIQQSVLPHAEIPLDQLNESQTSLTSLKYSDHKGEQDSQTASINTDDYYTRSQQSLNVSGQDISSAYQDGHPEGTPSRNVTQSYQHQQPYPVQQQVDPTSDPTYASRQAALPAYRQAPDYETVMQQKRNQPQPATHFHSNQQLHDMNQNIANTHIYTQSEEGLAYSQPEIRHGMPAYSPEVQYPVGTPVRNSHYTNSVYTNVYPDQTNYAQYRAGERVTNLVMQPTYSSPELTSQGLPQEYRPNEFLNVNETYVYHYKPPPPYPRASNSTPDLAVQNVRHNVSDSPDLVSRKMLGDAYVNQSNVEKSVENITKTIPEVVQISENIIQTEDGHSTQILSSQVEPDDASSDHSSSTFHVRETDSDTEENFVRSAPHRRSSKVLVRIVEPNKAPPPSTSKDVVTRRESFRRMMIARSGSFTPGVLNDRPKRLSHNNRSLRAKDDNSIQEQMQEVRRMTPSPNPAATNHSPVIENVNGLPTGSVLPDLTVVTPTSKQADTKIGTSREVTRSQSDATKAIDKLARMHEKAVSVDSSAERQQLLDKLQKDDLEVPSTIEENKQFVNPADVFVGDLDSDSDSDNEEPSTRPMGPLKMAAMNGLAMSRPMVLALMNDETRAPRDERRRILEKKLSENQVFKEFEETPKRVLDYDCNMARFPENMARNRFRDVLPYDCTRVKITPRKDNSYGYINGSHIKLRVGSCEWWYIATQAPMDNTPMDFWQMVWEQEVDVIGMLTALAELGRPKCYPYWPQDPGMENKLIFGDFVVTLLFTNDSLCYVTSRISLCHLPSKKERQVWHLQYTDWPDHGCPEDMYGFLGFLDEVESVQRLAESAEGSGKKSPVVIHCSAGVGRTGVVILTQIMKWCLEHNQEIDLPKALSTIRHQRMYMVQTLGQYNFIHKTLIQYLKNTRLI